MVSRASNPYLDFMVRNPTMFPWGSDDEEQPPSDRRSQSPGHDLDASKNEPAQAVGNSDPIYWRLANPKTLAGKILEHCEAVIHQTRLETGGLQLAIYKIGITHDCSARFALYSQKGWDKMVIMYKTDELGSVEMLEAALIARHRKATQCRNISKGGEGMRNKVFNPKFPPPYFCYCVSARADLARWVT